VRIMVKYCVRAICMAAIIASAASMIPGAARAEEKYTDDDASYVRVAARVVQPVGLVLEAVVFKPFTALMSWSDPVSENTWNQLHPRKCHGQRPHRSCSRFN